MPCSDSSSSISLKLDLQDRFISFEFAKITCGREISAETGYSKICLGKSLDEIFNISYEEAVHSLAIISEEAQFILYLEWDALRSCIAHYLGIDSPVIDTNRCVVTSVDCDEEGTAVSLVILPPKELPKILPCRLNEDPEQ